MRSMNFSFNRPMFSCTIIGVVFILIFRFLTVVRFSDGDVLLRGDVGSGSINTFIDPGSPKGNIFCFLVYLRLGSTGGDGSTRGDGSTGGDVSTGGIGSDVNTGGTTGTIPGSPEGNIFCFLVYLRLGSTGGDVRTVGSVSTGGIGSDVNTGGTTGTIPGSPKGNTFCFFVYLRFCITGGTIPGSTGSPNTFCFLVYFRFIFGIGFSIIYIIRML
jgi:hypothetical protein